MKERIRKSIEKNLNIWYMAVTGVILLCILGFLYVSQGIGEFVFQEHLDDAAFKVDGQEITLKEAAYYIMVIESNVNGFAILYDESFPKKYWNIYLNDGDKRSNFLNEQAKEDAMNACVRDDIYYKEAVKLGIELDAGEEESVGNEAGEQEKLMTGKMLDVTEYEYRDLYHIMKKIAVIKKYMAKLMADGYTEEELDVGGSYYESVRKKYDIWINEDLWKKISLGSVTIN